MAIRLDHLIVPSRDAPLRADRRSRRNRILVDPGVLDGCGHVSVRNPADPPRYLMSRSIAPELVKPADVKEYYEVR